ncbi:MAG: UDP-2,3-diacylglucosamine diphosphatase [Gammaproteobacteria bacterium]|nr:MAG: UDP-2,3-diacylglucosamine diphosphatase [Gammaproteobacteria bacterium]
MQAVLFISDLHLDHDRPELSRLFLTFLGNRGRDADAIYVLGDLFEAWVGDVDDAPLVREIMNGMTACADSGTAVFVLRGNRDFLLGDRFARSSGCTLLDDPVRIDLFGQAALLMHGDTLCTDDTDYLAFRHKVRKREWQLGFLEKPIEERRRIACELREASHDAGGLKTGEEMDVNPDTVARVMEEHGVHLLIHGHTHRQAVHRLVIDGQPATRIVLGSWDAGGNVLEYSPAGYRFENLEVPA